MLPQVNQTVLCYTGHPAWKPGRLPPQMNLEGHILRQCHQGELLYRHANVRRLAIPHPHMRGPQALLVQL
jgi:hypothetical protein